MQPFVNVSSIVDLTTPTKVLHRHDMMDLTSPSSVLQAEDTNDESDFPLQDADDKHKVGGTEVGTADVGSNDLASPFQREDKEQGLGISSDVTMLDVKLVVTQSQVANEFNDDPSAQNNDADAADATSVEKSRVAKCVNEL